MEPAQCFPCATNVLPTRIVWVPLGPARGGRVLAPAPIVGSAAAAWGPAGSKPPRARTVVSLTRPRGPRSIGVLPTLAEDLLDVVGRPYDGVDYVVLDDVRETMLDPAKSDHPEGPQSLSQCQDASCHVEVGELGLFKQPQVNAPRRAETRLPGGCPRRKTKAV
jgi:hypothetical protein